MTNTTPKTIRESIDFYRKRIAEEGFKDDGENSYNYPGDNSEFFMKVDVGNLRKMLEDSGQFKLYLDKPTPSIAYSMKCTPTKTLVICGREEMKKMGYPELRDNNWGGFTIHPDGDEGTTNEEYRIQIHKRAIDTLEILLSIAEKHRVPMKTYHKDIITGKHPVSYSPV